MSAGGIRHSEFNASDKEPVHFLQVWIQPNRINAKPGYAQQHFPTASRRNVLKLVASPDGADGSLAILQDARVFASLLAPGEAVAHELGAGRRAWVQVVHGALSLNGQSLVAGDGVGVGDETNLALQADMDSELLLFDLP